jgi:hypothetical protein
MARQNPKNKPSTYSRVRAGVKCSVEDFNQPDRLSKIEALPQNDVNNPAVIALEEIERDVWRMHANHFSGRDIAELMNIRSDEVCRIIQSVKRQIVFLIRFRDIVVKDLAAFKQFFQRDPKDHEDLIRCLKCSRRFYLSVGKKRAVKSSGPTQLRFSF